MTELYSMYFWQKKWLKLSFVELIVKQEPWINVHILKESMNFAEMLNMTPLSILAIVQSDIW